MSNTIQVAETILEQLGGSMFVAMTGAKNIVGDDTMIQFKVGRNNAGITNVRIVLNAFDTYTVTYYRIRGISITEVSMDDCVFAEDLRRVFEERTGLYTSL